MRANGSEHANHDAQSMFDLQRWNSLGQQAQNFVMNHYGDCHKSAINHIGKKQQGRGYPFDYLMREGIDEVVYTELIG